MNREDGGPPGRWLRQRREDAGLSQEELANRSGLSVRTVSSLERGEYPHAPSQDDPPARGNPGPAREGMR